MPPLFCAACRMFGGSSQFWHPSMEGNLPITMELRRSIAGEAAGVSYVEGAVMARGAGAPSHNVSIAIMAAFFSIGGCLILGLIWYFSRRHWRGRRESGMLQQEMQIALASHGSSTRSPPPCSSTAGENQSDGTAEEAPRGGTKERGEDEEQQAQASSSSAPEIPPGFTLPPRLAAAMPKPGPDGLADLTLPADFKMPPWLNRKVQKEMKEEGTKLEDVQKMFEGLGLRASIEDLQRLLGISDDKMAAFQASSSLVPPSIDQLTGNSEQPMVFQHFPGQQEAGREEESKRKSITLEALTNGSYDFNNSSPNAQSCVQSESSSGAQAKAVNAAESTLSPASHSDRQFSAAEESPHHSNKGKAPVSGDTETEQAEELCDACSLD